MSARDANRPRHLLAVLGSFAACVLLVAQIAAGLHFLLIPHRWCLEHGRIEHAAQGLTAAHVPERRCDAPAVERAEDDEHDECHLLARRREPVAVAAAPCIQIVSLASGLERLAISDAPPPDTSADVLLFAPKQSPPL